MQITAGGWSGDWLRLSVVAKRLRSITEAHFSPGGPKRSKPTYTSDSSYVLSTLSSGFVFSASGTVLPFYSLVGKQTQPLLQSTMVLKPISYCHGVGF